MSKSIKVSEKHGVNPTIPLCFYCGGHKEEIVLMGKLKDDAEAPKNLLLDYEPCDKCKEQFKQGFLVTEVSSEPTIENQPPITKGHYPTGKLLLIKKESAKDIFGKDKEWESMERRSAVLLDKEIFEHIFGDALREQQKEVQAQ